MQVLNNYVKQSYDIFNTYGKQTSAIENICMAFWVVLKDVEEEYIHYAFGHWLRERSNMPTPSEILDICRKKKSDDVKYSNMPQALEYKPKDTQTSVTVPWYKMKIEGFEKNKSALMPSLVEHANDLINLKGVDFAKSYFNGYLRDYIGYPISWEEIQKI
jgi:hypothetical protein